MHLISEAHGQIAEDGLKVDQTVEQLDRRHNDQDQNAESDEIPGSIGQKALGIGRGEPIDDVAEKGKERHFDEGKDRRGDRKDQQLRPERLGKMPDKGAERTRRRRGHGRVGKRVNHPFEETEHQNSADRWSGGAHEPSDARRPALHALEERQASNRARRLRSGSHIGFLHDDPMASDGRSIRRTSV